MDDFDRLMEIQRMTADRIRQESQVDNKIKVLDILNSLASGGKRIQVEQVIVEAELEGLGEAEVMATLDQLKDDGIIRMPEAGYVELV